MSPPRARNTAAGPSPAVVSVYLLTAAGTVIWLALIFLAPWLAGRAADGASRVIYAVFSPVCHQIPERCFQLQGHPLAVCGRCLGIYVGFAAGLLLYPLIRGFATANLPSGRLFLLLTLPMALDAVAGILGLWASPIGVRFATGAVWGTILPFFFVAGASDFVRMRKERADARALEKAVPKNIK